MGVPTTTITSGSPLQSFSNRFCRMNIKAFTLIEIIITLFYLQWLESWWCHTIRVRVLTQSKPIERFQYSSILNDAMELIVRDYDASAKNSAAITTLKTNITNFSTYYVAKCPSCSVCSATTINNSYSIGGLTNAFLVTITCTDPNTNLSEKLSHVFTIDNKIVQLLLW